MKAIQVDGEDLVWADFAPSDCTAGAVKIRVHATAINRADLLQRAGGYPPPPGASPIMGLSPENGLATHSQSEAISDGLISLTV